MVCWICPFSHNMLFSLQEGFAFAHCTTCKAPYYLRVHALADRKWRTLKFRFFVTRDILFIFLVVQLVGHLLSASVFWFFSNTCYSSHLMVYFQIIASLAYLVYMVDGYQGFWIQHSWGFDNHISFYYICGNSSRIMCIIIVMGVEIWILLEWYAAWDSLIHYWSSKLSIS